MDDGSMVSFLHQLVGRVRGVKEGCCLLVPLNLSGEGGEEEAGAWTRRGEGTDTQTPN